MRLQAKARAAGVEGEAVAVAFVGVAAAGEGLRIEHGEREGKKCLAESPRFVLCRFLTSCNSGLTRSP